LLIDMVTKCSGPVVKLYQFLYLRKRYLYQRRLKQKNNRAVAFEKRIVL
jgi:hypothetical protein